MLTCSVLQTFTKMKIVNILVLVFWFKVGLTLAVFTATFDNICQPFLRDRCANMSQIVVCYDDQVFQSWCDFLNAGCNGKLLPNVSSIKQPVEASCVFVVVIRSLTTTNHLTTIATTTKQPLTAFEERFFTAAVNGIDDLLRKANASGASLDQQKKIFTVQDHNHKRYIRNDKCWAAPLDLTAISPWNSQGHTRKAGTLISPRHALWARHYSMPVNTTIRFVDKNNNVVDRRIARTSVVPTHGHSYLSGYDIVIGELDQDVPSTISFAKVLPHNLTSIRPSNIRVPVFDTDFEEKALVADLNYEKGTLVWLGRPSPESIRYPYFETKIVGDSGNPVFLVVKGETVLMFVFTFGGSGGGTSITYHYDEINAIMKRWGSGYQLTPVDLSKFLDTGDQIPHVIG